MQHPSLLNAAQAQHRYGNNWKGALEGPGGRAAEHVTLCVVPSQLEPPVRLPLRAAPRRPSKPHPAPPLPNTHTAISMLLPGRTNRAVKNLFVGNLKWGARLPEIQNRWAATGAAGAGATVWSGGTAWSAG